MKKYKKGKIVAQNNPQGSYSAGCPHAIPSSGCRHCEVTK